ncbi:MAG: RNA-binding cell elongation regulator Jag/EloR [Anaerofustis sp.]
MKTVTAKGKTVEEAIQNALAELDTTADKVTTKVIDIPGTGLMGMFGSRFAKVEVTLDEDEDDIEINENDTCTKFLSDVFSAMNMDVDISYRSEEEILCVDLNCEDTGVLIGRRGQTLDALQYLTSLVVNKNKDDYTRISLDVANYREKRKDALQDLADRIAQKVQRTKTKYVLEPMNPYERRIIHAALQNYKNIVTYSEGEEPFRHIVIDFKHDKM